MSSFVDDALRGYRMLLIAAIILVMLPILVPIELALQPTYHYFKSWNEPNAWDVAAAIRHAESINVDDNTVHVQLLDPSRIDRRFLIWAEGWKNDTVAHCAFIADLTYHHQYPNDENKRYPTAQPGIMDRDSKGNSYLGRTENPEHYTINSIKVISVSEEDTEWEAKLGRRPAAWPAAQIDGDVNEAP